MYRQRPSSVHNNDLPQTVLGRVRPNLSRARGMAGARLPMLQTSLATLID